MRKLDFGRMRYTYTSYLKYKQRISSKYGSDFYFTGDCYVPA